MKSKESKSNVFIFNLLILMSTNLLAQKNQPDSLDKRVGQVEHDMKYLDQDQSLIKKSIMVPYIDNPKKKIAVTVYIKDSFPRKLLFRSYDESLTTGGQEMYYFDDTGKVMGHINLMIGATIHDIYSGQIVMIYTKSGKNINSSQLSNDEMSNYILADAKYVIDYYLSNFEGLKYSTFDVSNNTSYILKTLVNTTLRSAPDFKASAIKEIVRGVGLFYLDRSLKKDSVSGKGKWIWIKVKDKGKNVGWIWGHPSIVKPY